VIGADDVLDISVWKEPDVSRVVPVRPDGKISLPLVNDVQAVGVTPSELAATITADLKKYVNDPQVTVIVTQINSRRVYLVGEVARPGAFPLLPDMTVLQALASAGGFTTYANTKKIHILRMVNGHQIVFPFEYHDVLDGKKISENITLLPGDEIVVP
jgi:polysaccharide export outer membrane protein